jgi:hypothetical protein
LLNAKDPILVTVSGISIVANLEQVLNIESGIEVILAKDTVSKFEQLVNKLVPFTWMVSISAVLSLVFHEKQ